MQTIAIPVLVLPMRTPKRAPIGTRANTTEISHIAVTGMNIPIVKPVSPRPDPSSSALSSNRDSEPDDRSSPVAPQSKSGTDECSFLIPASTFRFALHLG